MEISRLRKKEKQAIKSCKLLLNGDISLHVLDDDGGTAYAGEVNKLYNDDLETVLNLVETQAKELDKKDKMIEKSIEIIANNTVPQDKCKQCIKKYFERKVEEDGNKNTEIG